MLTLFARRLGSLITGSLTVLLATSAVRGQCEVQVLNPLGGVAVCGDVAIVNSSFVDTVFVYRHNGTQWVQEAKLTSPDPDPDEGFAHDSALSGDVVVVGAPSAYIPGVQSGAAYTFRYDPQESQWAYEATLTASGFESAYLFGYSVAIDGDVILIGARDAEIDGMVQAGSAYVFRYDPDSSAWVEEAKLTDPDGEQCDLFGVSVSIRGHVALIGAHGNVDAGGGTGAAFVFRRDAKGPGDWSFEQQLTAFDAQGLAWFGVSVSLADDVAVIGAPQLDSQIGAAYVLRYDGKSWVHEAKLLASEPVGPFPMFGKSVSINAKPNSVVIGAPLDFTLGFEAGAAYVFRYDPDESPRWKEVIKLTASDGGAGDHFGASVSVSEDASLISAFSGVYAYAGIQGLDCNENGEPDACDIFEGTSDDQNGNGIPDTCDADLNGDGVVGILDLLMLLAAWGPCDPPCPPACAGDLNGNCTVNVLDLLILLANWG